MAITKHGIWTVLFPDKAIYKKTGDSLDSGKDKTYLDINHPIWSDPKFNGVHAIQFTDDNLDNDQVEYNDGRDNSNYDESIFGSFQQFIDIFDATHLAKLQSDWDNNNIGILNTENETGEEETLEQKTIRLGARPVSYSS
jgi:hypothetical protein